MGNRFEIEVWHCNDGDCQYYPFWKGESLIAALWQYRKAKKQGYGCVTLHWRGLR